MVSPHQQKLRINGPVVITANRLTDGAVVHRTADGGWTEMLEAAEVLTTAEAALAALRSAEADGLRAVGPYVAPVIAEGDAPKPANLREAIRRNGPSFPLPHETQAALPRSPANREARRERAPILASSPNG